MGCCSSSSSGLACRRWVVQANKTDGYPASKLSKLSLNKMMFRFFKRVKVHWIPSLFQWLLLTWLGVCSTNMPVEACHSSLSQLYVGQTMLEGTLGSSLAIQWFLYLELMTGSSFRLMICSPISFKVDPITNPKLLQSPSTSRLFKSYQEDQMECHFRT